MNTEAYPDSLAFGLLLPALEIDTVAASVGFIRVFFFCKSILLAAFAAEGIMIEPPAVLIWMAYLLRFSSSLRLLLLLLNEGTEGLEKAGIDMVEVGGA